MHISVVIPCHNAELWIGDCLDSVASQTRAPDEIIVVNDCSSDNSAEVIRASGCVTQLIECSHGNGAAARNEGIAAATGEWIAFQDADDIWQPNHLERIDNFLRESSDVAYLGNAGTFSCEDPENIFIQPFRVFPNKPATGFTSHEFMDMFSRETRFMMCSSAIRTERLREVGGLNPYFKRRHDIEMWLRVIAGKTWTFDPEITVHYRRDTAGSLSRNVAERQRFFLEAMIANGSKYEGTSMNLLLRRAARSAVSGALFDGNKEALAVARKLADPYLTTKDRAVFAAASYSPPMYRALLELRKQLSR